MDPFEEEFNYCEDDMNQQVIITQIPALKSPRQDPSTCRSQLRQIQLNDNLPETPNKKVQQYVAKKDKKLKEIKQQLEDKRMNECTFQPQTNRSTTKRTLNEFLQSQEKYAKKIEEKKQKLKKQLQQKNSQTFKPKTNQRNKSTIVPAHQRLYHHKEFQQDLLPEFKPQIQKKSKKINRNIPVQELLYNDAIRRTGKQKNATIKEKNTVNKNNKTQKFVAQKFIRQFYYIIESLNLLSTKQYGFNEFKQILRDLGFLTFEEDSQSELAEEERILADQAYFMIEENGVNARNTCVLLMALIGIFNVNPVHFDSESEQENHVFEVNEQEGRKLQKHFDLLFRNRLSNEPKIKKNVETKTQEFTYHPSTNYLSSEMAERYREKMITKANKRFQASNLGIALCDKQAITHEDLLVIDSMGKSLEMSQLKQKRQKQLDKECTFHPKTNTSTKKTSRKTGVEKSKQLYQYAKIKNNIEKEKNQLQKEQKSYREKDSKKSPKPKSEDQMATYNIDYAKNIDKTLARMYEGRKQRQQKNQYLARGQLQPHRSKPSTHKTPQKVVNKRNQPFIVIDVNMEDETHQIQFYHGDEKKVDDVVDRFCRIHSLDEENKRQLLLMVDQEVQTFLNTIISTDEL